MERGYNKLIKKFYQLTKPGIIYGNAFTAAAGFLLASTKHINIGLFLELIIGESLIVGSACVFNNYIDRKIDVKMARTKKRALVSGEISGTRAIIFGVVIGLVGFLVLAVHTNWLTVLIGAIGFVDYVVLYSYFKRRSSFGTIIGGISGATPPIAGYCAVTDHFGIAALILFITLSIWQLPHFYSIAMYRIDDYKAAKIPVLSITKGMRFTKYVIIFCIVAFTISAAHLYIFHYTRLPYLVIIIVLGVAWLYRGIKAFSTKDDKKWARGMFGFSLIVIMVWSVMTAFGNRI